MLIVKQKRIFRLPWISFSFLVSWASVFSELSSEVVKTNGSPSDTSTWTIVLVTGPSLSMYKTESPFLKETVTGLFVVTGFEGSDDDTP